MPAQSRPAHVFDDILDGYFPLGESLNQCLVRNSFATALVIVTHAPILDLLDRPGSAPVPLSLGGRASGLIRRLMVLAHRDSGTLTGVGDWVWHDGQKERPLAPQTRLAEPAFVRGVGLTEQVAPHETAWTISTPSGPETWGFRAEPGTLSLAQNAAKVFAGDPIATGGLPIETENSLVHMGRDWRI